MKKALFLVFYFGFVTAQAVVAIVPTVNADFSSSEILTPINHVVTFTDLSTAQLTNITSWKWDFNGDGVVDQSNHITKYFIHLFPFRVFAIFAIFARQKQHSNGFYFP